MPNPKPQLLPGTCSYNRSIVLYIIYWSTSQIMQSFQRRHRLYWKTEEQLSPSSDYAIANRHERASVINQDPIDSIETNKRNQSVRNSSIKTRCSLAHACEDVFGWWWLGPCLHHSTLYYWYVSSSSPSSSSSCCWLSIPFSLLPNEQT